MNKITFNVGKKEKNLFSQHTALEEFINETPVGINATPIATKIATTFNGVIIGCHARSFC